MMNRAALGIELRPTGTRRDTLGVFVAAVTPRGPAETAGIIEGDRIAEEWVAPDMLSLMQQISAAPARTT